MLKRWRGFAARPIGRRPSARASATKTVLIQIVDAKGTAAAVTPNYRDVYTMGDPRKYGTDSPLQVDTFGTLSPPFFTANSWINGVTGFFCLTRQYCGRDSGLDGSYNRHFYTVNSGGGDSRYVHSQERIYIDSSSGTEPQTIAHEQGHSIDFHFLDDFLQTDEGDEVEEALADMFAYDFERDRTLAGATGVRVSARVANPTAFSLPDHYSGYSCTTTDEHDNGHILSHGYWKLVQRIGHEAAGRVLQGVPWQLPARREFGDLREAMERAANLRVRLPGKIVSIPIRPQVEAAFNEVGVQDNARRTIVVPERHLDADPSRSLAGRAPATVAGAPQGCVRCSRAGSACRAAAGSAGSSACAPSGRPSCRASRPATSAVRKWIPPQIRASMTSSIASENRSKCLGWPGKRELTTSNAISSVPKKSCIAPASRC